MRTILATALGALALACGAAACGGNGDDASPAPETAETGVDETTSLEVIVYLPSLGGGALRYRLSCDPPTGTHPQAANACAALEAHPEALEPVPDDVACTQEFGGRQRAVVRGTFKGEDVEAELNRTNGCEIARWDRLGPLLNVA